VPVIELGRAKMSVAPPPVLHRLVHTEASGHGLVATQGLEAGETIFEVRRPSVTVLDRVMFESVCEWCLKGVDEGGLGQPVIDQRSKPRREEIKLSKCTGCRLYSYCSKVCHALGLRPSGSSQSLRRAQRSGTHIQGLR